MLLAVVAASTSVPAAAQEWGAVRFFQYNIENVTVAPAAAPQSWTVKVIFSVTDPVNGSVWDIKHALPFQSQGAALTLDIAWDPSSDFTNTGSANALLTSITTTALGAAAGAPIQVRNLHSPAAGANPCADTTECPGVADLANRFWVSRLIAPVTFTRAPRAARVAIEGRPVCNGIPGYSCPPPAAPPAAPYVNVPVPSAVADVALSAQPSQAAIIPEPRRKIVDIAKCKACHDGGRHGDTIVPRLSLHGGNRNENLALCVMCHTPNQTDVPYRYLTSGSTADPRIGGAEVALDFKTMVHAIHAGERRRSPFVVIGFNSSVNDFSDVRFPGPLSNCTRCHVDAGGRGSFELPLDTAVLGTTIRTQSVYQVPLSTPTTPSNRIIDVNPFNDTRISPTAATCSACHDKSDARSHMTKTGRASFATTQQAIGSTVVERCASCHGPGKHKDVRRVHEIGGGGDEHDDD